MALLSYRHLLVTLTIKFAAKITYYPTGIRGPDEHHCQARMGKSFFRHYPWDDKWGGKRFFWQVVVLRCLSHHSTTFSDEKLFSGGYLSYDAQNIVLVDCCSFLLTFLCSQPFSNRKNSCLAGCRAIMIGKQRDHNASKAYLSSSFILNILLSGDHFCYPDCIQRRVFDLYFPSSSSSSPQTRKNGIPQLSTPRL